MPIFLNDDVLDAALDDIIGEATGVTYCDGSPTGYSAATTLKSGGGHKMDANDVSPSDFAKADGTTSGRRLAFNFRQFVPQETGTVDHLAIVDDDTSTLIAVLETQSDIAVSADETGRAYNQDAVDILEIRDPS
jgi:hypothetical protein